MKLQSTLLLLLLVPTMATAERGEPRTVLDGHVAKIPHQHPVERVEGAAHEYFDVKDGGQVVVYVPTALGKLEPAHELRLGCSKLELQATSKRPRSKAPFPVIQYKVESIERLIDGKSTAQAEGILHGIFTPGRMALDDLEAKLVGYGRAALPALTKCADTLPANGKAGTCRTLLNELLGALPKTKSFEAWWKQHEGESLEQLRTRAAKEAAPNRVR